jgi:hypothetical protein
MELHSASSRLAAIGVIPRALVAGCTWAIVEGVKTMSIFQDIAVFFSEAHYITVLDAAGFSLK